MQPCRSLNEFRISPAIGSPASWHQRSAIGQRLLLSPLLEPQDCCLGLPIGSPEGEYGVPASKTRPGRSATRTHSANGPVPRQLLCNERMGYPPESRAAKLRVRQRDMGCAMYQSADHRQQFEDVGRQIVERALYVSNPDEEALKRRRGHSLLRALAAVEARSRARAQRFPDIRSSPTSNTVILSRNNRPGKFGGLAADDPG